MYKNWNKIGATISPRRFYMKIKKYFGISPKRLQEILEKITEIWDNSCTNDEAYRRIEKYIREVIERSDELREFFKKIEVIIKVNGKVVIDPYHPLFDPRTLYYVVVRNRKNKSFQKL